MAWSLTADFTETCSCNMLCPCWYGVKELMIMDQGYCAGALLFRVSQGSADGVDLSGRVVALAADWPGPTLLDGNGTGRLYIDDAPIRTSVASLRRSCRAKRAVQWKFSAGW